MNMIQKCLSRFATINAQYAANKARNAVRMQSQNINWDYEQLNYQSVAFAKGLKSLSYSANDNILIRIPQSLQAQSYVAKLGSAIINANLIMSKAKTASELDRQLSQNNVKGIIFEPTLPLDNDLAIDSIYKLMPQIKNQVQGSQIKVPKYPSLSHIFQTNFYSYPGIFKFRSILNYASDENFGITLSSNHQPLNLPHSNNPLVITNPIHDFAFKAAVLNSVVNGRFVICVEPHDVQKVANIHDGNIDLVATQQVNVNGGVSVFVEKNSEVMKNHGKRTQI